MSHEVEQSSFRDREGFVFYKNGNIYRAINHSYKGHWETLQRTGFFTEAVNEGKLVNYSEVPLEGFDFKGKEVYKVLQVQKIPFISYPNEWTFSQFKKAALLTLSLHKKALQNNFVLKDASAFNVQFIGPKAILIDTLSFEIYQEGEPWHAYKQFCQHFLAPLLLLKYGFRDLQSLFVNNIDGLPLPLVSRILPYSSRFNLFCLTHIHLHAKMEHKHGARLSLNKKLRINKNKSLAIVEHLEQGIKNLKPVNKTTNWTGYYDSFSYSDAGFKVKKDFVEKCLSQIKPPLCVDLGANTGEFSALAAEYSGYVVACDNDNEVVAEIQKKKKDNLLALHIDINSPTPAFGWNCKERKSFTERIKNADMTLALALVHHLCIGNNLPVKKVAEFFAGISEFLVIEFVPRTDEQVKKLLVSKKDIFHDYKLANFESAFSAFFTVQEKVQVIDSERVLFFMRKL